jgi:hypothetical protein
LLGNEQSKSDCSSKPTASRRVSWLAQRGLVAKSAVFFRFHIEKTFALIFFAFMKMP